MKATLISLVVAAAATLGTSAASAQNPSGSARTAEKPGRVECADGNRPSPFRGINLTAGQQARLKTLRAQCAATDSACTANARRRSDDNRRECLRSRAENRTAYLAKVKEILTPEQYVRYLENSYVQSAMRRDAPSYRSDRRKDNRRRDDRRGQKSAPVMRTSTRQATSM